MCSVEHQRHHIHVKKVQPVFLLTRALTHNRPHIHSMFQQLVLQTLIGQQSHIQLLRLNLVCFSGSFLWDEDRLLLIYLCPET